MTKKSIFLSFCIYNLEVLTYNPHEAVYQDFDGKSYNFSVISQLCRAAIN